jgi:hypothetical protein
MFIKTSGGAFVSGARVMLQGSGPGFRNLPVFAPEGAPGAGGTAEDGAGGEGGGDAAAFLATLNDDNRTIATENGWQGVDGVFEGYRSLQDKLSGSVALPGENATPEQQAEFYSQVSAGWTPKNGYQFSMPGNLPENFPYDQDFAKEAGSWFQEAGLHPSAAQVLHDKWVGKMAEQFTAGEQSATEAATQQAEAVETAHRELVKEFGEPSSDGYKNVIAKAGRARDGLKSAGIDVSDWFAEKGILTDPDDDGNQQVADPTAVRLLAFIHDKAFSEDGLSDLGEGGNGSNPFDKDKPDLKTQSELLDKNPARAKQLIEAAGRNPASFGL